MVREGGGGAASARRSPASGGLWRAGCKSYIFYTFTGGRKQRGRRRARLTYKDCIFFYTLTAPRATQRRRDECVTAVRTDMRSGGHHEPTRTQTAHSVKDGTRRLADLGREERVAAQRRQAGGARRPPGHGGGGEGEGGKVARGAPGDRPGAAPGTSPDADVLNRPARSTSSFPRTRTTTRKAPRSRRRSV